MRSSGFSSRCATSLQLRKATSSWINPNPFFPAAWSKTSANPLKKKFHETRHWFTPVESELERFGMKASSRTSVPKDIEPMLATLADKPFDSPDWLYELKMDGIRALSSSRTARSLRCGRAMTAPLRSAFQALQLPSGNYPAIPPFWMARSLCSIPRAIPHFELIQPRIHLSRPRDIAEADDRIPAYFYAFDLLYLNGYDLRRFPLEQRKAVLKKLIPGNGGWVRYNDHIEARGTDFFNAVSKRDSRGLSPNTGRAPISKRVHATGSRSRPSTPTISSWQDSRRLKDRGSTLERCCWACTTKKAS